MINVDIPGHGQLCLHHLVLDFNGTLARDGQLLPAVSARLHQLAANLKIHIITADTNGTVRESCTALPAAVHVLGTHKQDEQKAGFVRQLDAAGVVAIGNGGNDAAMLREAALGIVVLEEEGVAVTALTAADVLCRDISSALDLLLIPNRLIATLRR